MTTNELNGIRMMATAGGDYAVIVGRSVRAFNLTRERALDWARFFTGGRVVAMADLAVTQ